MEFSVSSLFAGFVFGVIGFALLKNGKKMANAFHMIIGIALIVFPYFVDSVIWAWFIGAVLCAIAWIKR